MSECKLEQFETRNMFYVSGITLPSVSANHKNLSLPVKSPFPQVTTNGTITTSSFGEYFFLLLIREMISSLIV